MATLENLTQAQFDIAEAKIIAVLRSEYPTLDLRKGTVIRELLVRPAASVYALNTEMLEDVTRKSSLLKLAESDIAAAPEEVDALLQNFNMQLNTGRRAHGKIIVRVDAPRQYTLASGFRFVSLDGHAYVTEEHITARTDPDPVAGQIKLHTSADGSYYYFIVDAIAAESGDEYNIDQGAALNIGGVIFGTINAEAYTDFRGGFDAESIMGAIDRLPTAISYRALESRHSIAAKLQDAFEHTDVSIQAVSTQGYGDRTQLRDKHNPMGFAVGSRVDLYVRGFTVPSVRVMEFSAIRIAPNTYMFEIPETAAPGFYTIRSISELDSVFSDEVRPLVIPVAGSYPFTEVRSPTELGKTWHDIDPDNAMVETAYTVFQRSTVTVTGVPASTDTHDFKVELYYSHGLDQLQEFVDDHDIRNMEADYIVRCPLICMVAVDATVYHDVRRTVDVETMRQNIYEYINTRSFKRRLTRSEISTILHGAGATRIDLGTTGMLLQGYVRDAAGGVHKLTGDALDLESVANPDLLLTPETTVFACEKRHINLKAVAE